MSKVQIVMRGLCLSAIPLLMGFAQEIVRPDVKTGLWETTVNTHMNGMPPIPDDVLARMTPEQKQRMMGSGGPRTVKVCVTEDKLNKGTDFGGNDRANCKRTIVNNTAKVVDLQEDCVDKDGTAYTAKIHYEVTGHDSVNGTMHVDMNRMGKAMTLDGTLQSKWIADSCGDVK
jgi:Protein of unknown function (DUF3617)